MSTGRFQEWKKLGEGASAVVHRARDTWLQCDVAFKILKPQYQTNKKILRGMRNEVRISRRLRDKCVCSIHDLYVGQEGNGIMMDVIAGIELTQWLKEHHHDLWGTAAERLQIFKNLVDALAVVHSQVIHRDLKPDNLFVDTRRGKEGNVVIMDFGIAMFHSDPKPSGVEGTPKYMAPEQLVDPGLVGVQADLFAVGMIAYELFTNRVAPVSVSKVLREGGVSLKDVVMRRAGMVEKARELFDAMDRQHIPAPSQFCAAVPPMLDRIIMQLMRYNASARPQSIAELQSALKGCTLHETMPVVHSNSRKVLIPAGEFQLGSRGFNDNESPPRRVSMKAFKMDVQPVTNQEYRRFLETTGYRHAPLLNDPTFGIDDHPVVGVTWHDAKAYAARVGGRLPTEAQWEYAAKGGAEHSPIYPWGDEEPGALRANINNVSPTTTPAGSCPSGTNAFGLEDMCGNVWEWCLDTWDAHFYERQITDGDENPENRGPGTVKSLRGGAFNSLSTTGRCAFRNNSEADLQRNSFGFRVVYDADYGDDQ
ncbi:SUMF1/EgtB/PvdO family nonheme iron enzyme [Magnetococcales bacterium HHB-1]